VEEPHFKVVYQNASCHFKIVDYMPMKAEQTQGIPAQINNILKYVKIAWTENYDDLVQIWKQARPSDRILMHQNIR
jgi:hypothetical protein